MMIWDGSDVCFDVQLSQHISWLTARVVLTSVANTCVTEIYHSLQHFLICTLHRLSPRARQSDSLRTFDQTHPSALVGPAHSRGITTMKQNQQSRDVSDFRCHLTCTVGALFPGFLLVRPPPAQHHRVGRGRGWGSRYAHTEGQKEERQGERGRTGAAVFPRCLPSNTVRATWTQATRRADLTHTHTRALRAGRGAAVGYRGAGVVQVVVAMWCYSAGLAPSLFIYIF